MRSERILDAIGDPARQNRFDVDIFAPGAWQQGAPIGPGAHDRAPSFKAGIRIRGIRCINAIIPGRSLTTAQFGEQGSGPKRSYPTGLDYAGQVIALTFISDTQFIDRRAMEAWQENIFNKRYGLNYPEEYYGTMTIRQLDRNDRPIYTVNLHEVWPQGIIAQDLNMASSAIQTFTVNFNYRTWSSQFENLPSGILGGIFQKAKRRFGSRILNKIEDKIF